MQRPYMPIYWGDYLSNTAHLETAQHGAYLLLIAHYWVNEGLPDDERELATITKLPLKSWRQMQPKVQAFFHDGWHHKRIDEEMEKYDRKIGRLKVAGSIGGTKAAIARSKSKQMLPENPSQAIARESEPLATARLQHLRTKNITSSFLTTTARASENPTISNTEQNQRDESVEEKSGSAMTQSGAGCSAELIGLNAAKRWVP